MRERGLKVCLVVGNRMKDSISLLADLGRHSAPAFVKVTSPRPTATTSDHAVEPSVCGHDALPPREAH